MPNSLYAGEAKLDRGLMADILCPTLEGEFVRLEALTLDHLADLEQDFDPSLFAFYPKPYGSAREFVQENLQMIQLGNYWPFAIIHREPTEAIGCVEFSGVDAKNRKLEIGGSWLKRSLHGSPANTEAKLLLLDHVFERLNFVRVQFTAHAQNAQSRAGIEGIGAKFEGIMRNAMILPDGNLRDDAYYSIIAAEWPQTRAALLARLLRKARNWRQLQVTAPHA